jgi:hypothetical protein
MHSQVKVLENVDLPFLLESISFYLYSQTASRKRKKKPTSRKQQGRRAALVKKQRLEADAR